MIQNDIANAVTGYPVTIVCAVSSKLMGYPSMIQIDPTAENGLTVISEVNTAQIMTVHKDRLTTLQEHLSADDMKKVEEKLAYMLGII